MLKSGLAEVDRNLPEADKEMKLKVCQRHLQRS